MNINYGTSQNVKQKKMNKEPRRLCNSNKIVKNIQKESLELKKILKNSASR